MSALLSRRNEKFAKEGKPLIELNPLVAPPRQPWVFNIHEFISKIHTLAPYIHPWESPEGLKYLEMICREMGFRGTTEEFTAIFYTIHPKN
jgi:hypothetical protein